MKGDSPHNTLCSSPLVQFRRNVDRIPMNQAAIFFRHETALPISAFGKFRVESLMRVCKGNPKCSLDAYTTRLLLCQNRLG